jgi:hypothetical protein
MGSDATGGSPQERPAADLAAETQRKADALAAVAAAGPLSDFAAKALALAATLSATLGEIGRRLDAYSAFGRRSRRIIIALAVSFALDIILTVVLGIVAFQTHGAAAVNTEQGRELHAAQLMACANGNVFRDNQTTIWRDFIVIITRAETGQTPAQVAKSEKLASQFLAYVATVNHPVDCTVLYGP